jgi:hypothetical protein
MIAKPIFIVRISDWDLDEKEKDIISNKFVENFKDYNCLVVFEDRDKAAFECYNSTFYDLKIFKKLKEMFLNKKSW